MEHTLLCFAGRRKLTMGSVVSSLPKSHGILAVLHNKVAPDADQAPDASSAPVNVHPVLLQ